MAVIGIIVSMAMSICESTSAQRAESPKISQNQVVRGAKTPTTWLFKDIDDPSTLYIRPPAVCEPEIGAIVVRPSFRNGYHLLRDSLSKPPNEFYAPGLPQQTVELDPNILRFRIYLPGINLYDYCKKRLEGDGFVFIEPKKPFLVADWDNDNPHYDRDNKIGWIEDFILIVYDSEEARRDNRHLALYSPKISHGDNCGPRWIKDPIQLNRPEEFAVVIPPDNDCREAYLEQSDRDLSSTDVDSDVGENLDQDIDELADEASKTIVTIKADSNDMPILDASLKGALINFDHLNDGRYEIEFRSGDLKRDDAYVTIETDFCDPFSSSLSEIVDLEEIPLTNCARQIVIDILLATGLGGSTKVERQNAMGTFFLASSNCVGVAPPQTSDVDRRCLDLMLGETIRVEWTSSGYETMSIEKTISKEILRTHDKPLEVDLSNPVPDIRYFAVHAVDNETGDPIEGLQFGLPGHPEFSVETGEKGIGVVRLDEKIKERIDGRFYFIPSFPRGYAFDEENNVGSWTIGTRGMIIAKRSDLPTEEPSRDEIERYYLQSTLVQLAGLEVFPKITIDGQEVALDRVCTPILYIDGIPATTTDPQGSKFVRLERHEVATDTSGTPRWRIPLEFDSKVEKKTLISLGVDPQDPGICIPTKSKATYEAERLESENGDAEGLVYPMSLRPILLAYLGRTAAMEREVPFSRRGDFWKKVIREIYAVGEELAPPGELHRVRVERIGITELLSSVPIMDPMRTLGTRNESDELSGTLVGLNLDGDNAPEQAGPDLTPLRKVLEHARKRITAYSLREPDEGFPALITYIFDRGEITTGICSELRNEIAREELGIVESNVRLVLLIHTQSEAVLSSLDSRDDVEEGRYECDVDENGSKAILFNLGQHYQNNNIEELLTVYVRELMHWANADSVIHQ